MTTFLDGQPTVSSSPDAEARAVISAVGKHWGVVLSFGIVLAGLGIAIMVWPNITIGVTALLLGLSLLVSGVFSLVASVTQPDQQTGSRVLMAISGALSIALGVVAFRGITQAVAILALIVGVGWLVRGVFDIMSGISAKGVPGRGWVITGGVLGTVAGIAVLAWPGITLTALAWVTGLWLVVIGIVQVVAAFSLRSLAKRVDVEQRLAD